MSSISIFGDPHGDFDAFHDAVRNDRPDVAIFIGDMDLVRPFQEEVSDLIDAGSEMYWIVGNHDTDSDEWHDNLFRSELVDRNIGNRIIDVDGVRIAGLGGVFRGQVWHPRSGEPPRVKTRAEFMEQHPRSKWRGGLPRKHRSTIFPEDLEILSAQKADILICHEAPSSHEHGFWEIDNLAEAMGVHSIIHGHHHRPYEATLPNGIHVVCVQKAGLYRLEMPRPALAL